MRSNKQAVDDAWAYVVGGARLKAAAMFSGVSIKTAEKMQTALRKLTKHAPECVPSRMTWKEAQRHAEALSRGEPSARKIAEAISKAAGTATVPVRVMAEALTMANAALPEALMDLWEANNVMRGVRHEETEAHA